MSNKSIIGLHINNDITKIITHTLKVNKYGGNIIQLFVNITDKAKNEYIKFKKILYDNKMICVVHASYTINCSQNWNYYSWWINQCIAEIEMANVIGAFGIVVHIGKQLNLSIEESLNNMFTSLLHIHKQTILHKNVKIFIETSTGQGTEMCYKLEDLEHLYKKFSKHKNKEVVDRFGICLDTCHVFAAGYDLSNNQSIKNFFEQFDELIGLGEIKLVHLNDSKNEVGSQIDRHENIGFGYIGKKSLIMIAKMFSKINVPIVLETPYEKQFDDLKILL